jgi:DNA replication protein DnaC
MPNPHPIASAPGKGTFGPTIKAVNAPPTRNVQIQIDRALAYGRGQTRLSLDELLRTLHLPAFRTSYEEIARMATAEKLSYEQFLWHLCDRECLDRFNHRTQRFLHESRLPLEKNWSSFDEDRLPLALRQQVGSLRDGGFLDRCENVLAFGNPGSGKTHLLCALCQDLVTSGRRILYRPCSLLVQDLLAAKRDLTLSKLLKRLSLYEGLIIDDIGYVQQSRDEMEVLFTLLAERYERGSVLITSNLAFSGWDAIFKDPMTAAAAIDRLVHHSVILELNMSSYRMTTALNKTGANEVQSVPNELQSAPVDIETSVTLRGEEV